MTPLILYRRQGCCLCDGLEERLRALTPPPELELVDVDGDPELQARFGLEVPVLAFNTGGGVMAAGSAAPLRLLPRVPPRLAGDRLALWLRTNGFAGTAP